MKITCQACGAKYAIADEKVRGRKVKVRCKSCSTAIVVDGTAPDEGYADPVEDEAATRVVDTRATFGFSEPAPADAGAWSVNLSDSDQRTMTVDEIVASSRNLQVLVATDVAARGLDVSELTHVINFNLPDDPEVYIHRSGRTGRAGKFGISIAIIHSRETMKLKQIEKITKKTFEAKLIPGGREICEKRLFSLIDNLQQVAVDEAQIKSFLPDVLKKLSSFERDELIKRFVSVEFNHFLEYYKDAKDINISSHSSRDRDRDKDRSERPERGERGERDNNRGRGSKAGYARFFINVGTKENITTGRLIGIINEFTNDREIPIGKIDILRKFSFFEVERGHEAKILRSFTGQLFEGVELEVQLSKPEAVKRDTFKSDRGDSFRGSRNDGGDRGDRGSRPRSDRGDRSDRSDRSQGGSSSFKRDASGPRKEGKRRY